MGAIGSPWRCALAVATGTSLGLGGVTAMQGCETIAPAVYFAAKTCIELIKEMADSPRDRLPVGYERCGEPVVWTVRDQWISFCFYCSDASPNEMYVQIDCTGKYFPFSTRPVPGVQPPPGQGGSGIDTIDCDEWLLTKAIAAYDEWSARTVVELEVPNDRVLPDIDPYTTLGVAIDGAPVSPGRDFSAESGQRLRLEGSMKEVAHFAMTAGVEEMTFSHDGARYEVFLNADVSAIMVFKDGACIFKGPLFAPTP